MWTQEKANLMKLASDKFQEATQAAYFSGKRQGHGELTSVYIRRMMGEAADHMIAVAKARHREEYNAGFAAGERESENGQ